MTKYREIIRLASLNLSQTNIALSCGVSKKTVNKVLKAAREKGISWPLNPNQTDAEIEQLLFPKKSNPASQSNRRMPNYTHIRKELLRNGVNKKLLWTEYLEECRLSGDEPLMNVVSLFRNSGTPAQEYSDGSIMLLFLHHSSH